MINVKVKANKSENSVSLLRRFSRRVQGAGILGAAKSNRYNERPLSDYVKKKKRLKSIKKKIRVEKLIKLGQMTVKKKRKF